jgi:mannose-6-phosphate isomerase-like protein (cupin superfamily)
LDRVHARNAIEVALRSSVSIIPANYYLSTIVFNYMADPNSRKKYSVRVGLDRNLGAELKVAPDDSDNDVAVVEHTLPPEKLAAPLHRHSNEDEISYILEGRMGVQEGDDVSLVEAGETALKGRGVWHTFWNPGPDQLRFLEIITPGDFAWYFAEADRVLPETGEPDAETANQLAALHGRYEFEIDPESVPRLVDRHGLGPDHSE